MWILKSLEASCGAMSRIILQPISKLRWLHCGGVTYWGSEGLKQSKKGKWEDVQKREEEKAEADVGGRMGEWMHVLGCEEVRNCIGHLIA